MPRPADSKPRIEAVLRHLPRKILPPPSSASLPLWPTAPVGLWCRGSSERALDGAGNLKEHKPWFPSAPRSWDKLRPTVPVSSAWLPRPWFLSLPCNSPYPWGPPGVPCPIFLEPVRIRRGFRVLLSSLGEVIQRCPLGEQSRCSGSSVVWWAWVLWPSAPWKSGRGSHSSSVWTSMPMATMRSSSA